MLNYVVSLDKKIGGNNLDIFLYMVNFHEDENDFDGTDTDTLANDLEASLEEVRRERLNNPQPQGHPKFGRIGGGRNLVQLEVGKAGFARLPGSPNLVQI